ncbi:hypothetical protein JL720_5208 [Aureococcus anophagefferens]|nr:hypothetical protein JL720_5208 [Aureococcus anophagefferens]
MPPSSGVVAASPASGTAMATAFAAAASLWAGDALPLRYGSRRRPEFYASASVEPSAGGLLLAAGTQVITVAVTDAHGAAATADAAPVAVRGLARTPGDFAVDEDSVGETFANFATANRRVLRSADESRFLGTATMNASATLRPLASLGGVASSVYMTLSEFAVDPYGASSDAGASTLRFLASDGAATRRRLAGASTNLTVALSVPSGDYGETARRLVLGPVPEAVSARFPRLARLCCAAEGEAEASVAPDVEGAPDDEDRGAPPAPDFASCACFGAADASCLARGASADDAAPAAAAEESLEAVLGLDKEASQHAPVDDEVPEAAPRPPVEKEAAPLRRSTRSSSWRRRTARPRTLRGHRRADRATRVPRGAADAEAAGLREPGPDRRAGPGGRRALLVEDGDGVMEKKTTVPKALQKTLFDEKTADTLQWMPSATWEDDVGDGSRSLGDESSTGRRRRGTMQAAKRRSTDAARALAQYHYTVKAAVTMDQRRGRALSSQLAAPVARGVAAQLRELDDLLAALEARRDARARDARIMVGKYRERLLRRWGWGAGADECGSGAAWRVELRLRHHMKDADRWHDRLVDLRARCDDDRAYLFNAQACEEIDQTLKFSSSVKSKLIRLIFGRIDRSR